MKAYTLTVKLRKIPIEDHPRFCKPNASLRFQNKRIRKQFRQMKDSGIETFARPVWKITKL